MEPTLKEFDPSISIGKIVIQQSSMKEEGPRLFYCKFPTKLASPNNDILLLDATIGTGNILIMAIQVLLDHSINLNENNIFIACLAASAQGIHNIVQRFPSVNIITTWIEDGSGLDEKQFLYPGMGSVGDRYFGTENKEMNGQ